MLFLGNQEKAIRLNNLIFGRSPSSVFPKHSPEFLEKIALIILFLHRFTSYKFNFIKNILWLEIINILHFTILNITVKNKCIYFYS